MRYEVSVQHCPLFLNFLRDFSNSLGYNWANLNADQWYAYVRHALDWLKFHEQKTFQISNEDFQYDFAVYVSKYERCTKAEKMQKTLRKFALFIVRPSNLYDVQKHHNELEGKV